MKFIALLMLILLFFTMNNVFAQNRTTEDTTRVHVPSPPLPPPVEESFDVVEQEATYPGGDEAMHAFIRENVKYPEEAVKNKEQGKVYVRFVIEKDGSVSNVRIARGVSPSLDAEAVRVVQAMPNWYPGLQRGRAVRTNAVIPIIFKL
jgi:periplasmic protein TonB